MKKAISKIAMLLLVLSFLPGPVVAAEAPPVKKSKNGICHPKGGRYYARTKHYIPYPSMEACLKSGGRRPRK